MSTSIWPANYCDLYLNKYGEKDMSESASNEYLDRRLTDFIQTAKNSLEEQAERIRVLEQDFADAVDREGAMRAELEQLRTTLRSNTEWLDRVAKAAGSGNTSAHEIIGDLNNRLIAIESLFMTLKTLIEARHFLGSGVEEPNMTELSEGELDVHRAVAERLKDLNNGTGGQAEPLTEEDREEGGSPVQWAGMRLQDRSVNAMSVGDKILMRDNDEDLSWPFKVVSIDEGDYGAPPIAILERMTKPDADEEPDKSHPDYSPVATMQTGGEPPRDLTAEELADAAKGIFDTTTEDEAQQKQVIAGFSGHATPTQRQGGSLGAAEIYPSNFSIDEAPQIDREAWGLTTETDTPEDENREAFNEVFTEEERSDGDA